MSHSSSGRASMKIAMFAEKPSDPMTPKLFIFGFATELRDPGKGHGTEKMLIPGSAT
jgi:hypothetical protein